MGDPTQMSHTPLRHIPPLRPVLGAKVWVVNARVFTHRVFLWLLAQTFRLLIVTDQVRLGIFRCPFFGHLGVLGWP